MTKRLAIVLLSLLLALASCNRAHDAQAPKREMSPAEYEVLTAWIDATFASENGVSRRVAKVVVLDTTDSDDDRLLRDDNGQLITWEKMAATLCKKDPALQKGTLDPFRRANIHQALLRRFLYPSIDYALVTSSQLDPIFCKHCGFWPEFYKLFPGSQGILTVSGIGISPDGDQAFFYVSNVCEGLCGRGDYVVMEKQNGAWVIQNVIAMWVS